MTEVKEEVRQFYDEVGWQLVGADVYQNARYEDLRPVSRQYIHDCHLRVARHLRPEGRYLLDAGSGPVQYPEYLEYSGNYEHRVCADISITALKEARRRLGEHGLYVVADIANLPLKSSAFEGVVSLHTIHHLPEADRMSAYEELFRVLAHDSSAVVVNGWSSSKLMNSFEPLMRIAYSIRHLLFRMSGKSHYLMEELEDGPAAPRDGPGKAQSDARQNRQQSHPSRFAIGKKGPKGTFTNKHDADWVKTDLGALMPVDVLVWRSVTVRFMRALIHPRLGGRFWLGLLYRLEERYPHYFGENGKYPLIVIRKVARQT
jgi:SAM-dependent methyltransferase